MMKMAITIKAELGEAVLNDRQHKKLSKIAHTLLTFYEIASKHVDICSELEKSILTAVKNSIKELREVPSTVIDDQVPSP